MNVVRESFLQVLFLAYIHHHHQQQQQNTPICQLVEGILQSIVQMGIKGNPTDYLLDITVVWLTDCHEWDQQAYEDDLFLQPIRLLLSNVKGMTTFHERVYVESLVCSFVKSSNPRILRLIEQEKEWVTKKGWSVLEVGNVKRGAYPQQYCREEHPLSKKVEGFLQPMDSSKRKGKRRQKEDICMEE